MQDLNNHIRHSDTAAAAEVTSAPKAETTAPEKKTNIFLGHSDKRQQTRGERAVNWGTHRGLNLWFNSTVSVFFTRWLKHQDTIKIRGEKLWDVIENGIGVAGKNIFFFWKHDKKWFGEQGMGLFVLALPGWVLLPIITKIEQNKEKVVRWADNLIDKFKKPSEQELEIRETAYKALAEEPKPTGLEMIRNRLVGWFVFNIVPTYAINHYILGPLAQRSEPTELEPKRKVPTAYGQRMHDKLGFTPVRISDYTLAGGKGLSWMFGKGEKFEDYADIAGQEVISCTLTSVGLKYFIDFFKRRKQQHAAHTDQAKDEALAVAHSTKPSESTHEEAPRDERIKPKAVRFTPSGSHVEASTRVPVATNAMSL